MLKRLPTICLLIFYIGCTIVMNGADKKRFQTEPRCNTIHSLFVCNTSDWMLPPIISLQKEEQIYISFDELSLEYRDVYYEVIHCNADWSPSSLNELDYLSGFNRNPLKEAATSFNTHMDYTHYALTLPNDEVQFKLSGNYAVRLYDYHTDEELACACFSITEDVVSIAGNVIIDTDIAFRKEYQQVEFAILTPEYKITNPHNELRITVQQNRRNDNQVTDIKPNYVQNDKLVYEHQKKLIFEAGNEYRRFEMITTQYQGMGIERIEYEPPYYHVELQLPVADRLESGYSFSQDLNGRSYIRSNSNDNSDTEADYCMVHYDLPMPLIREKGALYVMGEFTNYKFNDFCRMQYDDTRAAYHAVIPMKQGVYDYQYLFVPENEEKGTTRYTEGNYYETENEYLIMVYHRPVGSRYDRLIGYQCIKSN